MDYRSVRNLFIRRDIYSVWMEDIASYKGPQWIEFKFSETEARRITARIDKEGEPYLAFEDVDPQGFHWLFGTS